ncbi:hypothetical protein V6N13_092446 [Hibiscus sabdariffa]|uniref:RNase H type-1 domain-containing protein n=1 Tax=Hibiscus sabdariffa TaxID=183260 RepID=A0ABR2CCC9_9ROSI
MLVLSVKQQQNPLNIYFMNARSLYSSSRPYILTFQIRISSRITGLRQSIHMLSTSILAHVAELNIVGAINLSSLPPIPAKWSSLASAKACESAVTFALELGFRCVYVEGDSLTVIRKLSSAPTDKSIIQPIIGDIKAKLQFFEKVTFSHVGRQGNAAAHALAKLHTQFQMPKYWIEEALPEVEQISIYDLR